MEEPGVNTHRPSQGMTGKAMQLLPPVKSPLVTWIMPVQLTVTKRQQKLAWAMVAAQTVVTASFTLALGHLCVLGFNPILCWPLYIAPVAASHNLGTAYTWDGLTLIMAGLALLQIWWRSRGLRRRSLEELAITEELQFRQGAEDWNWGQRTTSCLVFGLVHYLEIILTIWLLLPARVMLGALCTYEYLRAYRHSGSRQQAVAAASALHIAFNRLVAKPWVSLPTMAVVFAAMVAALTM